MINIDELKFDDRGLIPAIVQDATSKRVLTLAYMNRESLEITLKEKKTCFWSRSRQELWLKGETSGNYQHVVSIIADCDRDALTVLVNKDGPACHMGTDSCFEYPLVGEVDEPCCCAGAGGAATAGQGDCAGSNDCASPGDFSVDSLYQMLQGRKADMPEGSYTSYLFAKGIDKILKKVGEESTEVIIAAKAGDKKETVYEIADLYYHVLVMMVEMGISTDQVMAELASRHVIDHKVKQEKMTE
ncbi:bifunctional phosphoribosyl-AMP cyclohydrolase/phosphoribosyl-ATP diphosphatase HisIE [Aminicella lysinilytica]|uniref:bifunctional phosphoribosyl-AMP cyclohydrolase/phosphoribosyl-ATP diphosphatase HisIE n=1 Tax=Aminicella lysinilytica TaxID=433323 RepID=UPI0026EF451D|nr:bifunctional phosphoribosyl-AMP cyclohydrolase/phosphoribosyl-ATP diphosphatase HisIE [Aminicella lysinilytica]